MGAALSLARRNWGKTSPNPSVGALLVQNDEKGPLVIGRGVTAPGGAPHAEPQAISMGSEKAKGSTLYVTLEPCNHHGRTAPCTEAIIEAGMEKVIIGAIDPDSRVSGNGVDRLKNAGIDVLVGCRSDEANSLICSHKLAKVENRPFILAKVAVGADNLVAPGGAKAKTSGPAWVTNEIARLRGHLMRAQANAILIGRKTAEIDNPRLNCRLPGMQNLSPIPVILDSNLKVDPNLKLLSSEQTLKSMVVTTPGQNPDKIAALQNNGVVVIEIAPNDQGQIDLKKLMYYLSEKGMQNILIEGGPTLIESFLQLDLVDELAIFKGASKIGHEGLLAFGKHNIAWPLSELGFTLKSSQELESDTLSLYEKNSKK